MDETDVDITFDNDGVCNHCRRYNERSKIVYKSPKDLISLVNYIKNEMKNHEYDCALGISGGLDSTYVAYIAKKLGLRMLLIHFDNGWNTSVSTDNVKKIVNKTGWNIINRTCDFEEIRDIQLAYLKAGVKNFEVCTDYGIFASVSEILAENKIPYLLAGGNLHTEGVLPSSWGHDATDVVNLIDIHKKHGSVELKSYPLKMHDYKEIRLLNYINYKPKVALNTLEREWNYQYYGWKHGECLSTRFFQHYILPVRWEIDKRKAHLSALILSGNISRNDALKELKKDPYSYWNLDTDKKEFLKKLRINEDELSALMNVPKRKHTEYKTDLNKRIRRIMRNIRRRLKENM